MERPHNGRATVIWDKQKAEDLELDGDTRYELQFEQGYRGCEELADFGRGLCPAAV